MGRAMAATPPMDDGRAGRGSEPSARIAHLPAPYPLAILEQGLVRGEHPAADRQRMFFCCLPVAQPYIVGETGWLQGDTPEQAHATPLTAGSSPAISRREHMARTRKSPIRIRLRVANRPGQVFRAGKGRGSYRRAAARVQIAREQAEE